MKIIKGEQTRAGEREEKRGAVSEEVTEERGGGGVQVLGRRKWRVKEK